MLTTHIRAAQSTSEILGHFILASLPLVCLRSLQVGEAASNPSFDLWFKFSGHTPGPLEGALYLASLFGMSSVVAIGWQLFFSKRSEQAPLYSSSLMTAWLFTLLVPPGAITPLAAAFGLSFGLVVGQHIFGGVGRYLVSPALLGVLFIHVSYPELVSSIDSPTWDSYAALASTLGGAYLVWVGAASYRTLLGGSATFMIASLVLVSMDVSRGNDLAEYLLHSGALFVLAFILTDPTTNPLTGAGRWLYSTTFALMTIAIYLLDSSRFAAVLHAALLAALMVPLFDYLVTRRHLRSLSKAAQ